MPGHTDLRVSLQRLAEKRLRFFTIARVGAVPEHHGVEAANLGLFEAIRKEISLPPRDLKMIFGGFPLMCPCRGEARESL